MYYVRGLAAFLRQLQEPANRYRAVVAAIALPTVVTLPCSCRAVYLNPKLWVAAWPLASFTALVVCLAEFRTSRAGRRAVLAAVAGVTTALLLFALWVEWFLVPALSPSQVVLRFRPLRTFLVACCLVICVASLSCLVFARLESPRGGNVYRGILAAMALPTIVAFVYSWAMGDMNLFHVSWAAVWALASLALFAEWVAEFRMARRYGRHVLGAAVAVKWLEKQ